MEQRSLMMLKVFINHYNPKVGNSLLRFLPKQEAEQIMKQPILSTDVMPLLYQPQRMIERMHYSWLQPLIEQLPEQLRPLALAVLSRKQASNLKQYTGSKASISVPVKTFMMNHLYSLLEAQERLPVDYLPETDLLPLVYWSKYRLVNLIDFLGLHDLTVEIKQIVDKKQLNNIYNCLSPAQLAYLKICLHQKELLTSPKLGIDLSKQDCNKLKQVLHRRGLLRLAKALCGQHPDFIWYLAHTLDTGRGKFLLQNYKQQTEPEVTHVLKQQVLNLMNFLKKSSAS